MKGSLAKAIRTIDALRLKKEAADVQGGAESKVAVVPAPVDSEASAPLETPVSEAPTEAPAEVLAEATPETPEATPETPEA
jgi:large subunit ribosomal protein L10